MPCSYLLHGGMMDDRLPLPAYGRPPYLFNVTIRSLYNTIAYWRQVIQMDAFQLGCNHVTTKYTENPLGWFTKRQILPWLNVYKLEIGLNCKFKSWNPSVRFSFNNFMKSIHCPRRRGYCIITSRCKTSRGPHVPLAAIFPKKIYVHLVIYRPESQR